ncbi:uncharacterized protein PFL1_03194 [Pseudozyma flocculosa PF-1]|uniref:Carboxylic ester hydrolase n=2 Tax=Pseudozyma flocculosa TaxID=84751 RepID=A0A5C3F266_9BASI|nr:uncharacterized protein PFL1_03194 [Pseudozyma flocculosa PF-1]EPQ29439.1 hypothetical protein PFL1_03194 [Pseudozyma flocculosa PF-1]SPO37966.1 related to carboxylesterase/lipase EstA precursor [Pseudozyma flocculosa]
MQLPRSLALALSLWGLALGAVATTASPLATRQAPAAAADDPTTTVSSLNCAPKDGCTNLGNSLDPLDPAAIANDPVVRLRNGSYAGVRLETVDAQATLSRFGIKHGAQDLFLGMPFAQQPTGDRRFRRPQRLAANHTWQGVRSAKSYSPACYTVGIDNDFAPPFVTYRAGEDCLTVNVVRPASASASDANKGKLPVFVWIYGGGFNMGSSADQRYNGSFLVDQSVGMGKPIIFVSLNYRTGALGFPVGDVADRERITNLGLYDQRVALHWIRDNIPAFGGDPDAITIAGESAGGASMLFHNTAYRGRDDGLFSRTIAQSSYYATQPRSQFYTDQLNGFWTNYTQAAGCARDDLDCLRRLPLGDLAKVSLSPAYSFPAALWNPQVDGELVAKDLQRSFLDGDFVKGKPIILHNNINEGLSFGVRGVNTSQQIIDAIIDKNGLGGDDRFTKAAQMALLEAYPDEEGLWPPYQAGDGLLSLSGRQDRRSCAIFGDLRMVAPRREVAELLSSPQSGAGNVYVSRFDQAQYNATIDGVAQHFAEVCYVFRNPLATQNALGPARRDIDLADEMAGYWISFVTTGDPNAVKGRQGADGGGGAAAATRPQWPRYDAGGKKHLRFKNSPTGERTEVVKDSYRPEGIRMLNEVRAGTWKPKSKREEL